MYKKQLMFFMSMLVLVSAFFFGCNEDQFEAGVNLVPDSLKLKSDADTFKIEAYTYQVKDLHTENASKVLVGKYTDPILGDMNASFVTQMIPAGLNIDSLKKNNTVVDSLVLYLRYPISGLRAYGDSTADCEINVMRVNNYLDFDSPYFYNFNIAEPNPTTLLQTITFNPKQIIFEAEKEADSIYIALFNAELADTVGGKLPDTADIVRPTPVAVVPIKFSNTLHDEVVELIINSIEGGVTFAEKFGGLYFTPSSTSSNSAISIFDYTDAETKASLYYHTATDTLETILEYPLALNSYSTRFNLFNHNYNAFGFLPDLQNPESKQDNVVYVHGTAGLRTKILFPGIEELKKQGRYAVNRAELILPAESSTLTLEETYPAPQNLTLFKVIGEDDEEKDRFMEEFVNVNSSGGSTYSGAEYSEGKYIFDITLYIQKILDGKIENNGLMLQLPDESTNPSRVVLTSPIHSSNKMKLILTLTKLSD